MEVVVVGGQWSQHQAHSLAVGNVCIPVIGYGAPPFTSSHICADVLIEVAAISSEVKPHLVPGEHDASLQSFISNHS